jgi:hypothetical protein
MPVRRDSNKPTDREKATAGGSARGVSSLLKRSSSRLSGLFGATSPTSTGAKASEAATAAAAVRTAAGAMRDLPAEPVARQMAITSATTKTAPTPTDATATDTATFNTEATPEFSDPVIKILSNSDNIATIKNFFASNNKVLQRRAEMLDTSEFAIAQKAIEFSPLFLSYIVDGTTQPPLWHEYKALSALVNAQPNNLEALDQLDIRVLELLSSCEIIKAISTYKNDRNMSILMNDIITALNNRFSSIAGFYEETTKSADQAELAALGITHRPRGHSVP